MKDLKYMTAYLVPLSAFTGLYLQGWWTFSTVLLVFCLIPVLEPLGPRSTTNYSAEQQEERSEAPLFDWLLYLNIPIMYGLIWYFLQTVSDGALRGFEVVGMVLSVGIVIGSCGINVAHELGHRSSSSDRRLAKLLLLPALYLHFYIEHNRGHHRYVGTPRDPASARKGENLYSFWFKTITRSYLSAWRIQLDILAKSSQGFWSQRNRMLIYQAIQIGYLAGMAWAWNIQVMLLAACCGLIGVLLLESINYIEHYGLRRREITEGLYERVMPHHSWNANQQLGRIMLYELTRHSDHHYLASKKYQNLDHHHQSPELPTGYPTSILMALFPPLWFAIMDGKVPDEVLHASDGLIEN